MKSTVNISILVFCTFLRPHDAAKDLPKYFPKCHRSDPNMNQCMLEATEKVKPFLAKGVPELGLPTLEPFYMPEISFEQGTSAINLKATMKDILLTGLTNYTFSKISYDFKNSEFFGAAVFSQIKMQGKYVLEGKILAVPLDGSGTFNNTLDDCTTSVYQKLELVTRKGEKYIVPSYTNSTMRIGKLRTQLNGLFGGNNKELAETTNKLINDNADELVKEMQPVLEKVMSNLLDELVIRAFVRQVPYDKLYPE